MDKYYYTCIYTDFSYNYTSSYTFIVIMWYVELQEYLYLSILTIYISIYFNKNYTFFVVFISFYFFILFKYLNE